MLISVAPIRTNDNTKEMRIFGSRLSVDAPPILTRGVFVMMTAWLQGNIRYLAENNVMKRYRYTAQALEDGAD